MVTPTTQKIPVRDVLFVRTHGSGSLDYYSRKLAEHLEVATLDDEIVRRSADIFNLPLLSVRSLRAFRHDVAFVRALRRTSQGLIHLPSHHLGRYARFLSTPYVITVHDLMRYFDVHAIDPYGVGPFMHVPNRRDRALLRADYGAIADAAGVIAVSDATKRDLIEYLRIPEERVFVVYEGVDRDVFRPVSRRPIVDPYVLYVGTEQPRKNIPTLLRAFAALKREPRFHELKLVKVGKAGGGEGPFRTSTLDAIHGLGLARHVVFTEYVQEEDLPAYYAAAECLVAPALYEGFGFPPLEAMACGCPVVVSTGGSVPEIGGDAAMTFHPLDAEALAEAMRRLLTDATIRHKLRARGLERAATFSWEAAARRTAAVYETTKAALTESAARREERR